MNSSSDKRNVVSLYSDPLTEERALEAKLTGILESVIFLEDDMQAGFNVILQEIENDGCVSGLSLMWMFTLMTIISGPLLTVYLMILAIFRMYKCSSLGIVKCWMFHAVYFCCCNYSYK